MTAFGLQPSFIKIFETSAFSRHVRTLPIKQWIIGGGVGGSVTNWSGDIIDVDTMVKALVNKMKVLVPATTSYDYYEVWNYPTVDALPIPVATNALSIVGTSVSTGWSEAVEETFHIQTEAFGKFKLVMLDIPTDNFFGKVAPADFDANVLALIAEITAVDNAWSGRDGARPALAKSATITLNEKLRRSYKLT